MIEINVEFPQREVIQAEAEVNEQKTFTSEIIINAKPEITGVTASVDNNVGTPSVDVTPTGTSLEYSFDLAFHNLKGDRGDPTTVLGEGVIEVVTEGSTAVISSKTYIHEQGVSADVWEIEHNLNKFPSVTLVDSAGTLFQGRVEYIDENNCIIYMNGATKGKAYLN